MKDCKWRPGILGQKFDQGFNDMRNGFKRTHRLMMLGFGLVRSFVEKAIYRVTNSMLVCLSG